MGLGQAQGAPFLAQKPPKLETGKATEFLNAFPSWLKATCPHVTDEVRLQILEGCVPAAAIAEIRTRREAYERGETGPPTYREVWSWIARFYSGDPKQEALKALRELTPYHQGKVTSEVWLEYTQNFRLNLARISTEVREEEVWAWAWENVPHGLRPTVTRELAKRDRHHPVIRATGLDKEPVDEVQGIVKAILERAGIAGEITVETDESKGMRIRVPGERAVAAVLARSGELVDVVRSGELYRPRFCKVDARMTLDELFRWVYSDLKCTEEAPSHLKKGPEGGNTGSARSEEDRDRPAQRRYWEPWYPRKGETREVRSEIPDPAPTVPKGVGPAEAKPQSQPDTTDA